MNGESDLYVSFGEFWFAPEPMDRILLWAVQLQGQWRSISTELSPDRHRGWPTHPSQRSGGCSTIIEEREVGWSWQHPSSAGVDNILAELVQAGGEDVITTLTTICSKIWQTGDWPTPWTQSLVITLSKKGNLQQCQNYRMISFIINTNRDSQSQSTCDNLMLTGTASLVLCEITY